jgi:hypothetical protein
LLCKRLKLQGRFKIWLIPPQKKDGGARSAPINPTRLLISGVVSGLTRDKLRKLFPKSVDSVIPMRSEKKGKTFAFVQFRSPVDAKAAFDAAKKLVVDGNPVTVLFAKMDIKARGKRAADNEEDEGKENVKKAKKQVQEESDSDAEEVQNDDESEGEEEEEVQNDESDSDGEEVENDDESGDEDATDADEDADGDDDEDEAEGEEEDDETVEGGEDDSDEEED